MAKPLKVITILFATIFSVAFISVAVLLLIPSTRQYIADKLSPYATEQEDTNTNNEQLQQLTAQAEELQNLLNTYVNQNYQQQQQINSLRQQLANLEINQGAEFEQLQQQKQQLQTELESALQNVTTLTTNLQQYQQLANQLQTQITAIQTQLDATLEEYESANLQIAQLQNLLNTTNQAIEETNARVSEYQDLINQLQERVIELGGETVIVNWNANSSSLGSIMAYDSNNQQLTSGSNINIGTEITLTAVPNINMYALNYFKKWSVNDNLYSKDIAITFTVIKPITFIAYFDTWRPEAISYEKDLNTNAKIEVAIDDGFISKLFNYSKSTDWNVTIKLTQQLYENNGAIYRPVGDPITILSKTAKIDANILCYASTNEVDFALLYGNTIEITFTNQNSQQFFVLSRTIVPIVDEMVPNGILWRCV